MTGLPMVLAKRRFQSHCEMDLMIKHDNPWFQGHFPGRPVLPGVVQIGWAAHFASEIYAIKLSVNTIEQLKFKHPMLPNTQLTLHLTPNADKNKLHYEYLDSKQSYSSGTLIFEAS